MTHGQGLNWLQVTLTGRESHTGSTPMPKRVNAGLGMARITQLVDEIAWSHAPLAVGAVGHCDVYPTRAISFLVRLFSLLISDTQHRR